MKGIKAGRHILISGLVLAVLLLTLSLCTITALADGQDPASGKQLVIRVVEDDEELFDLGDRAVPLAAFPGASQTSQPDGSGTRHIVLMAVMLVCVVAFAIYYGHNEKKLIRLRNQATKAEYRWMINRRQSADQSR